MKKQIFKITPLWMVFLLLGSLLSGMLFQSCEDDDSGDTAVPEIHYVRLTDPAKSDSLVVRAFLGNTIALVGENLGNVKEVWFNDQSAKLNVNYITDFSIIVTIPNAIPQAVTNEITLITKSGIESKYPFNVDVPAPLVASMLCEYVGEGETAVIKGNFFLDDENIPLEVFFPGNITGEIVSIAIDEIQVKVPAGTGVGPITVKSLYGSTRSSFYFRDDRGFILDWDNLNASGGWRAGVIRNDDPVPGINGNYVYFAGDLAGDNSSWNEDGFSFNLWGTANGRPQGDLFSIPVEEAVLKFEVNVSQPWSASALQMIFTPWSTTGTNSYIANGSTPRGLWNPWKSTGTFQTDGWITVSVPLSEFKYDHTGNILEVAEAGNYGGLTFFVYHGGIEGTDCSPVICIDNIRVVPK
jgi:hypothetical protein